MPMTPTLSLIGIGSGNPEHLTLQALRILGAADLILIPLKGAEKQQLAQIRRDICDAHAVHPDLDIVEFALPVRDPAIPDYLTRVEAWHDAIADAWIAAMAQYPGKQHIALLVWGDPSLYDSSLRIAGRVQGKIALDVTVVPGITSLQGLCAGHAIPLNEAGQPVMITTGRKLREEGWPAGVDRIAVMLDGENSFQCLDGAAFHIWWGAYISMSSETILAGRLDRIQQQIMDTRQELRQQHGWIMDMYILQRLGDEI